MKNILFILLLIPSITLGAEMTITIPDAVAPRVLDAMAQRFGYEEEINGQPNPQTKAQFARQVIIQFVKETVVRMEALEAARQAKENQEQQSDAEIQIE